MEIDPEVAHTYAEGLIEVAEKSGRLDVVFEQAPVMQSFFQRGAPLRTFLENPKARKDQKHAMIDRVFGGRVEPLIVQLLHVMLRHNRMMNIDDTLQMTHDLVEEKRGIVRASAITAVPLDDAQRTRLQRTLEARLGLQFRIQFATDPDVLGGVIFKYDDHLFDGSLRHDLQHLRERLTGLTSASFESVNGSTPSA